MKRVFAVAATGLVASVVAMAGTTVQAGHPGGAMSKVDHVGSESFDTYRVAFYRGQWAQVRLHGAAAAANAQHGGA
jgi:hypothetical protein